MLSSRSRFTARSGLFARSPASAVARALPRRPSARRIRAGADRGEVRGPRGKARRGHVPIRQVGLPARCRMGTEECHLVDAVLAALAVLPAACPAHYHEPILWSTDRWQALPSSTTCRLPPCGPPMRPRRPYHYAGAGSKVLPAISVHRLLRARVLPIAACRCHTPGSAGECRRGGAASAVGTRRHSTLPLGRQRERPDQPQRHLRGQRPFTTRAIMPAPMTRALLATHRPRLRAIRRSAVARFAGGAGDAGALHRKHGWS